jgi:DNA-binding transcriptional regulator YhcF (GntR family)
VEESPVVTIDSASAMPPFEQVRSQLANQINDGTLAVGTKLPTVRKLASDLGLAANTVARAYRELEDAGLVDTRGRAGTFVSATGDRSRAAAAKAAREYAATAKALGLGRAEALSIVRAAIG